MKKFLYIPSFDTAVSRVAGQKNYRLKDGTPWRFWSDEYPEKYRWKTYLTTAGHNYKKSDYIKQFEFPEDMIVFGDSGGFQICSGVLKWSEELKIQMFNWLENNSTVAMNLDIPPRAQWAGKFREALDISKDNFRYFADNQTGKTEFLNILQGSEYQKYKVWYDEVGGLPFNGWSIGGAGGSIYSVLAGLTVLLENKEIEKTSNKWLHILGASGINDFLLFAKIQQQINLINPDLTVTTDSSTPSRSTSYGFFYSGYDIRRGSFRYFRAPKSTKKHSGLTKFPIINEIDSRIWNSFTMDEFLEWKSEHYAWLVSRNFAVFLDCYNLCNELVYTDPYITEQSIPIEMFKVLFSIEELFNSSRPSSVLEKYKDLYLKISRIDHSSLEQNDQDFF